MHKVFLGIGGNIGDKHHNFMLADQLIEKKLGKISKKSSIYETPPWGFHSENLFWNRVICIDTQLEAEELLWRIKEIEDSFTRKSSIERYTDREMDVDILYFDEDFYESKNLIIPHPRIHERKFVLVPLAEIAPVFKHPLLRMTSLTLLENCKDKSIIRKVDVPEES
ncbi:2-amino-4-hydroxy-6-hydroxymethyldihydropteridine diphosphokinase [Maribellus mangrovi]|uniref:2-amino-4-hydroxy-6- hydroxymethyldihydropteridine diphosphokinase n=1 Tax=Maribellus mangrovi TaxID=3133146 RepID=UPI0030EF1C7A